MNIEKELQADRQAVLTVTYESGEFEAFKRRGAKKIAKSTKIPGFRPGKAPYQVIVNHYGESAILQEAIDILLEDDYPKIIEQAEVEPSGPGNLDSIESYDPPVFKFSVPLEPEVDLANYRDIRKDYQPEPFEEDQVDEYITNLRRNSATIIPADHPAEEGNLVYFNLSGEFLNPEEGEDSVITDKTPQQMVIAEKGEESSSEWPYPGFSRALLGVKAGETKEIQYAYPDDAEEEEYRGKTAVFSVDVQSVKELELPELDDDFVQSQGNFESVKDYRKNLEEQLQEQHQMQYDQEYFDELLKDIIEQAIVNYPPQMMEHEKEHVLEDIKSRLERQRLDFETYLKLRNLEEEAFIEEEVIPVAKERLKRSLIIDSLIEKEQIKIDQVMLKDRINDVMTEVYYSGNAEDMKKQMGDEAFSRVISMEGVSRTMNAQLQTRLKLIATGQPIPEEQPEDEVEDPNKKITEYEDDENPEPSGSSLENEIPESINNENLSEQSLELDPTEKVNHVSDEKVDENTPSETTQK